MTSKSNDLTTLLASLSGEEYCYLTTIGRVTGKPHEIEIWFVVHDNTLHLMAGGKYESDWVKNLLKNPSVSVRIANHTFSGTGRILNDETEEMKARYALAEKYQEWEEGRTLSNWAKTALPIAIDVSG
jgi:deazaflavin-dependent oxidoreductase (nitroreductase family)